jgi:hypothetical protein
VLVGGAGSPPVGGGGAVSGWSSAGGAVCLGADGWVFLRFTVFLLTSFLSSSWATFSPTYRLSRIADKALMAIWRTITVFKATSRKPKRRTRG